MLIWELLARKTHCTVERKFETTRKCNMVKQGNSQKKYEIAYRLGLRVGGSSRHISSVERYLFIFDSHIKFWFKSNNFEEKNPNINNSKQQRKQRYRTKIILEEYK